MMLNHFGFVGVWVWDLGFSLLDDFRSKSSEDGMLSMTSVSFSQSIQPASGCRGRLFIAYGAVRHDKTQMPLSDMTARW